MSVNDAVAKARKLAQQQNENKNQTTELSADEIDHNDSDIVDGKSGDVVVAKPLGRMLSFTDMTPSNSPKDGYLKVNEHGLSVTRSDKKTGTLISNPIKVAINFSKVKVFEAFKYDNTTPPVYVTTYDRINTVKGTDWVGEVTKHRRVTGKDARIYQGIEFDARVLEDVIDIKGVVNVKAGEVISHSTSLSNKTNAMALYEEVLAAGLEKGEVEVLITSEEVTNKAGNVYGILAFEFLGAHIAE